MTYEQALGTLKEADRKCTKEVELTLVNGLSQANGSYGEYILNLFEQIVIKAVGNARYAISNDINGYKCPFSIGDKVWVVYCKPQDGGFSIKVGEREIETISFYASDRKGGVGYDIDFLNKAHEEGESYEFFHTKEEAFEYAKSLIKEEK